MIPHYFQQHIYNVTESANLLNEDPQKISEWAFNWKMLFNSDITKQPQEVVFSHKSTMLNHPTIFFNETLVANTACQKHLGIYLDEKLNFNTHIKENIAKANKGIGIIHKLAHVLPRESLGTICKSFVRLHIDY